MSRPPRERSPRRLALILFAALALGAFLGRLSAPTRPGAHAATSAGVAAAQAPSRHPARFPRTPAGAARAVGAYERSFATPKILQGAELRKRIEAVATPAYAKTMLAANQPGAWRLARGPIGEGLRQGTQTLYSAVPIGYRVESFAPRSARVLTWGFTLLGNASSVEPAAYFGLTHTELRWIEGRWRIAETRGGFGPTPRLGTPPGPLGAYRVINLSKELRSYALAP
jgi:hypothetical protein